MAGDLATKMDLALSKLEKLDTIEKRLDSVIASISSIEETVGRLDKDVLTLKKKTSETERRVNKLKEGTKFNETELSDVKRDTKKVQLDTQQLRKQVLYLEAYSRRENLKFAGIPENILKDLRRSNEQLKNRLEHLERYSRDFNIRVLGVNENEGEDCKAIVLNFITSLGLEDAEPEVENAHHTGKKRDDKPRPIIAKLYSRPFKRQLSKAGKEAGSRGKRNIKRGETNVIAGLCQHGIYVQRWRVRESVVRVDPINRANRWGQRIQRRPYGVPHPNYLWHIDTNMKLHHWRMCIHGCVDGYSRTIIYLVVKGNNSSCLFPASYRGVEPPIPVERLLPRDISLNASFAVLLTKVGSMFKVLMNLTNRDNLSVAAVLDQFRISLLNFKERHANCLQSSCIPVIIKVKPRGQIRGDILVVPAYISMLLYDVHFLKDSKRFSATAFPKVIGEFLGEDIYAYSNDTTLLEEKVLLLTKVDFHLSNDNRLITSTQLDPYKQISQDAALNDDQDSSKQHDYTQIPEQEFLMADHNSSIQHPTQNQTARIVTGQEEALQQAINAMHGTTQRQMGIEGRLANCEKVLRLFLQVQISSLSNSKQEQKDES
ncbi:hypothetical protein ACROYT_G014211 [Oculina patagonica]